MPASGCKFRCHCYNIIFIATDRARTDQGKLAAAEATQSTEVLFVMAGEMLLLGIALPSSIALAGVGVIIAGMVMHSYHTMLVAKNASRRH